MENAYRTQFGYASQPIEDLMFIHHFMYEMIY